MAKRRAASSSVWTRITPLPQPSVSVSWEALLDYDWPRQPHPALVAMVLAKIAQVHIPEDTVVSENPGISVWTVAAAMIAALGKQAAPLTEAEADRRTGDDETFVAKCLLELACGLDAIQDPRDEDAIWGALFCMIGAQHSLQADVGMSIVRARAILGVGMFDDSGSAKTDELIQTHYGADLATVSALVMVWIMRLQRHPAFHVERVLNGSPRKAELDPVFARMIRGLSREAVDVRKVILDDLGDLRGLYAVTYAFWQQAPAVHLGSGHYLLAPYRLVAAHVGFGLVLHVMRLALQKHRRPDNPVTVAMGHRFQRYVHRVLVELNDHEVIEEHEFVRDGPERSADHLVFDPDGRCVTVVEDKLRRLSRRAFFGHGLSALEADIKKWIAPALRQVLVYLYRLQVAAEQGRLAPAREQISRRVAACTKVNAVVVVPALPPILHGQQIRDRIAVILRQEVDHWATRRRQLGAGFAAWHSAQRSTSRLAWHVLEADDIETFVAYRARHQALGATIRRYLASVAGKAPIDGAMFLRGFGEYVRSARKHKRPRLSGFIHSAWQEAMDESNLAVFGRGATGRDTSPEPPPRSGAKKEAVRWPPIDGSSDDPRPAPIIHRVAHEPAAGLRYDLPPCLAKYSFRRSSSGRD